MIAEFLEAWPLFGDAWLAGCLIGASLGACGVLLVARDQIFLGAAVAQATAFGLALALCLGGALATLAEGADPGALERHGHDHAGAAGLPWFKSDRFALALAAACGVLSAWMASRERRGTSREARTGWIFLGASAGAVLLVAHSPHGLEEVKRLHASTLLGATRADAAWCAAYALATGALFLACWRRVLLLTLDPEMAAVVGLNVARWNAALAVGLGLGLALAIRSAGTLYAFGMLILPALVARRLCLELRSMLWVAPSIAFAGAAAGIVLAHRFDYPPAHVSVTLLALALPLAGLARMRRPLPPRATT